MKTSLSHILLLALCSILFISCDNENDDIVIEKQYNLAEIQWALNDDDGEEIIEVELPSKTYENKTGETIKINIDPLAGIEASSHFFYEDEEQFTQLTKNAAMVTPTYEISLLSPTYAYVVGSLNVPFQLDEYTFPLSTTVGNETELSPNTKFTHKATVRLKKIKATYRARFTEKNNGADEVITGKWEGIDFHSIYSEGVWDEIKDE